MAIEQVHSNTPLKIGEYSLEVDKDGNYRLNYSPSRRLSWVIFLPLAVIVANLFLREKGDPISTIAFVLMAIVLLITPGFNYFCPELILSRQGFAFLSWDRFTPYDQIKQITVKSLVLKHNVYIETAKNTHIAAAFASRQDADRFIVLLNQTIADIETQ